MKKLMFLLFLIMIVISFVVQLFLGLSPEVVLCLWTAIIFSNLERLIK